MENLKKVIKILFAILVVIVMVIVGWVSAVYYENWEKNASESDSRVAQYLAGADREKVELKPNFTCLFMGKNQHLTDFIMLAQYNPNTRQVALLSIPRDTYVNKDSVDGKINSIYMNKYPEKEVAEVEKITGVNIQHYVVFDTKILRNIVNEIGGVTVDVPINMDYDDPYQNLYIHLKKGVQKLTGAQAEQFVRFRKGNNGKTGYPNGDIGRIAAQQSFIKALVSEVLKPENIGKINNLVQIVLNGTKTDITTETIEEYLGDVVTFKTDRITTGTLPGVDKYMTPPYGGLPLSYWIYDPEETKVLVNELFYGIASNSGDSGDAIESGEEKNSSSLTQEVVSSNLVTSGEEKDETEKKDEIRIEVLNANSKANKLNTLVEKLKSNDCNVVKLGNYSSTSTEESRIITYSNSDSEKLEKVKSISGIKKTEENTESSSVDFTIIIGPNY